MEVQDNFLNNLPQENNATPEPKGRENETHHFKQMITALFTDQKSLEEAYSRLLERNYTKDEINLIMSDSTRERFNLSPGENPDMSVVSLNGAASGAGAGTAVGATVGAVVGVIAALGTSVMLPGLGILVAGPIAAGIAGAGAGAVAGGIIGSLVGVGFSEDKARLYEKGLQDGGVILGVHPHNDDDVAFIKNLFENINGKEIHW